MYTSLMYLSALYLGDTSLGGYLVGKELTVLLFMHVMCEALCCTLFFLPFGVCVGILIVSSPVHTIITKVCPFNKQRFF